MGAYVSARKATAGLTPAEGANVSYALKALGLFLRRLRRRRPSLQFSHEKLPQGDGVEKVLLELRDHGIRQQLVGNAFDVGAGLPTAGVRRRADPVLLDPASTAPSRGDEVPATGATAQEASQQVIAD